MQVTSTKSLVERLSEATDPAVRKVLKAAIYLETERALEKRYGKSFIDMPSSTAWTGNGMQRIEGLAGYQRDARKTRRRYSLW